MPEKETTLAESMVKIFGELENPKFDKSNPHFGNPYASLPSIKNMIRPIFNKHGVRYAQDVRLVSDANGCPVFDSTGNPIQALFTEFSNTQGEKELHPWPFIPEKEGPQGAGSAGTYSERQGICAALGIAGEEDDDGEAAEKEDHGKPKTDTAPPLVDTDNPFLPPEEVIKIREAWDRNEALDKKRALPDYQADITKMLWKMNDGDVGRGATMLFNYSSFQPEGGEVVPGKRDITKFSYKWAKSTCHKLEKGYEKYKEDNPEVTPEEVDAFFAQGGEVP